MNKILSGGCIVRASELQDAAYTSQLTYHILRERGAPIIGEAVLLLSPNYHWFVDIEDDGMTIVYRWEELN